MRRHLYAVAILGLFFCSTPAAGDAIDDNAIPNIIYDHLDGKLYVDADGADMIILAISVMDPGAYHFEHNLDPNPTTYYWQYAYTNGEAQFYDSVFAAGLGAVTDGPYHILTVDSFLTSDDFGRVTFDTLYAGSGITSVTIVPEPASLAIMAVSGLAILARKRGRR